VHRNFGENPSKDITNGDSAGKSLGESFREGLVGGSWTGLAAGFFSGITAVGQKPKPIIDPEDKPNGYAIGEEGQMTFPDGKVFDSRGNLIYDPGATKSGYIFKEGVFEGFSKHAFAGGRHSDLGLPVDVMASKGLSLIEKNMVLLKTGDNTLVGNINGIPKSFKTFVQDGKIMSVNMYPGISSRSTQGTVINFGNVKW
jgi:hypothetical protein